MGWAEFLIVDGLGLVLILLYYRKRPKPLWLLREIAIAKAVARFFHIMKMVRAKARI